MPSKSKQQQKFMGIVRAIQKGEAPAGKFSKAAQKAAKSMKKSSVKKYAKTKHDDLPKKVSEKVNSELKKIYQLLLKYGNSGKDAAAMIKKNLKYVNKTYRNSTPRSKAIALVGLSSLGEAVKRDYKAEYKKFQSSTKSKKYRAELNKYNRKKGTYGNGDGKDASHKGGKIVGFEKESKNRGRAEKSRLKKEGKLNENPAAMAAATAMTKIKMKNPKTGKDVSAASALKNKDNPNHKKAKSIFQRLKDKFSKKKKEEPKKQSKADADFYKRQYAGESVNEAKDPDVIAQIRGVLKKGYSNVKDPVSGKKMKMDSYTASAITQVYDAINASNKKKFSKLPILKMQNIAFKVIKK